MKKTNVKEGMFVEFKENVKLKPTQNSWDFYYDAGFILSKPSVPYGEVLSLPTAKDDKIWQVVELTKFKYIDCVVLAYVGNLNYKIVLSNCRAIAEVLHSNKSIGVQLTERQQKAQKIRSEIKNISKRIEGAKRFLEEKTKEIEELTFTAVAFEKYQSDEEALAAMLSEVLKTGGDQDKIMEVLKKTGVTNKL